MQDLTAKRKKKFLRVVANRQPDLTVVLENVVDPHNIGAVLRSCDSVGVMEVYAVYSNEEIARNHIILGKRTTKGTRKWVDVHLFNSLESCFAAVRKKYNLVIGADYNPASPTSMYDYNLAQSVALVFGNERDGLSEECLNLCDASFMIPQVGMAESLNISVACAVTLYEAFRQRQQKGYYDANRPLNEEQQSALYDEYKQRSIEQVTNRKIQSID